MKIKVCGMRNVNNIAKLIKVQPNFIGFIFHRKSPRNVEIIPSVKIPNSIKKVGVFVNKEIAFINAKIQDFRLDFVQLHGKETSDFCKKLETYFKEKELNTKIIKAFNINNEFDFTKIKEYEPFCEFFIFDAFGKKAGGNGITFNWELLQNYHGKTPFLLSGGINETMVEEIKKIDHPKFIGVDINSGFEIEPALKNIKLIKTFINGIRS